jgi:predicted nucleotidyltransferase
MMAVLQAAAQLQAFIQERGWRFCFIGGLALQRWGEPRVTVDVDVTLLTGSCGEEAYAEALLARYEARISDAKDFALKRRVLLLKTESGVGIDIAFAALPFEESIVRRSTEFEFGVGLRLRICSAEDLVVLKAFADRDKDWLDVEGVLIRQGENMDWGYIREHLAPLCELKEAPGIVERLDALRERLKEGR